MKKSIEKIRQELEQKRRHNTELLQSLKQRSIIYNTEKEKQKKYFLNKTSTFLNKKRKASNSIDNAINSPNEENTSYDIIHSYEDYDDYYEDFMNNSMISNKRFNNLNFCRPERFALKNKKKKYSIENSTEFSIHKTMKPTAISKITNFSYSSSFKDDKYNNKLGIFKGNINEMKKNEKEISYFESDENNKFNKDNKNAPKKTEGLFVQSTPNINNTNNNEIPLFKTNITYGSNNDEKKEIINKDNNKEENKEKENLFGDGERLNKTDSKNVTLFGSSDKPITVKEKEEEKEKEKEGEKSPKTPGEEKIQNNNNLYISPPSTPKMDQKKEETVINKIAEDNKKEISKLLEDTQTIDPLYDNNKEKKETIQIPLASINEKAESNTENKNDSNNNKSLFGDILSKKGESNNDQNKEKTNSLFGTSLFANSEGINNNTSLFFNAAQNNNDKKEEKEKLNLGLFNTDNTLPKLIEKNDNNNNKDDNPVITKEDPIISSNAKGSLVTASNPFLSSTSTPNIPNEFDVHKISKINYDTPQGRLFNFGNNPNTNIFSTNNNNEQKQGLFGNVGMNAGNTNNTFAFPSGSLFNNMNNGNTPNNNQGVNLFGAPIGGTNSGGGFFGTGNLFQNEGGSLMFTLGQKK